mmetsp:Transcript_10867/g.33315  ORF Transcript_10867/g.33315 Transcript_10867/m.33315 type:complete len:238 (+) Transcript_10867:93-806(+)|eukprot:CAMPEP_0198724566 /NCGR_PEP_ID=MMETSP1475-20131203/2032_1 /TAXON_ID= ORGANISM="Unidentified sp., Strain CCMP1999" /NCGR_SAMPLE_ID=MMETSP1475 /ASSEMBLY_ACC=CAM_ASM_001111 /LENGTH=237 /DNA_ID=CAMNT_0044486131 /DNA_START=99 /DNA_END=812 /DNA_ORIENTATION=+
MAGNGDLFNEVLMEVLTGSRGSNDEVEEGASSSSDCLESLASSFEDGFEVEIVNEQNLDEMDLGESRAKAALSSTLPALSNWGLSQTRDTSLGSMRDFEIEIVTPRLNPRSSEEFGSSQLVRSFTSKTAELSPIPEPKQFKRWKNATPSKFCHFCGRLPKTERVICRNINQGTCRKVFCRPCMEKIFGGWDAFKAETPSWECTHCAGACPTKASCRYYSKTNSKRFLKNVPQQQQTD